MATDSLANSDPKVWTIRQRKPGDLGQVLYLHGLLYAQEFGFDLSFEEYVAAGLAEFAGSCDPERDRLWVAEVDGRVVGSIAIFGRSELVAQLRWLIAHPDYRGRGLGRALLTEAVGFCREYGFETVYLWTLAHLGAARHLYKSFGFQKTEEKTHLLWGQMLTEERYELRLKENTLAALPP
ncbi:MAG: GNAT family N-acetyltransferase [Bacillota bacterium]